ncbi:MAG: hypothetical protein AAF633_16750 [Chloroflexota bacterium]
MLDRKRDAERARRKGIGGRFVFQLIWFVITIALSFWLARLVFSNGILSYTQAYGGGIPNNWPTVVIDILLAVVIFLIFQIIFTFGFILGNPAGRRQTSKPSLTTFNPEYYEDDSR